MTRAPVHVVTKPFREEEIVKPLGEIVAKLTEYLETYPRLGYTRHAIMGPIPRVIDKLRSGESYLPAILGEAYRQHEMASPGGYVDRRGQQALEAGVQKLADLLRKDVPVTYRERLLEKVDLGVYYERRKKASEWMEAVQSQFIDFMERHYRGREEEFKKTWKLASFKQLRYPSRSTRAAQSRSKAQEKDVAEFYDAARTAGEEILEAEEDEVQ